MRIKETIYYVPSFLLLLILFASQANAATHKWVDENGVTHFGDWVPEQYRGDSHKVRVWSDTTQRNDTRSAESNNSRHAIPEFENRSRFSNEEWEQRVREMESQRRKVEESIKAQALQPRHPKRAVPESKSVQENYEELKARHRKAQMDNAKLRSRKMKERPKTYEQKMEEYKASQHCFNGARNVNGTINVAVAKRLGCKNVKRPRRD